MKVDEIHITDSLDCIWYVVLTPNVIWLTWNTVVRDILMKSDFVLPLESEDED